MSLALQLLLTLMQNAANIASLIATAQAEGRDVTPAELQTLIAADAQALVRLVIAIAAAKAAGR